MKTKTSPGRDYVKETPFPQGQEPHTAFRGGENKAERQTEATYVQGKQII